MQRPDRCCVCRGNRVFQFFSKYLTSFSVMLIVILVIQDLVPAVRAQERYCPEKGFTLNLNPRENM